MKCGSSWPSLRGESCCTKHNTLTRWMWDSPKLFLVECLQPGQALLRTSGDADQAATYLLCVLRVSGHTGCLSFPSKPFNGSGAALESPVVSPPQSSPTGDCPAALQRAGQAHKDVSFSISVVLGKNNTYHHKGSSHFAAGFLSYCDFVGTKCQLGSAALMQSAFMLI